MEGSGLPGVGNLDVDPLFVDEVGGNLALLPTSPCIDAGDPDERGVALDLAGSPRYLDGDLDGRLALDMGVYERGHLVLALSTPAVPGLPAVLETSGTPGLASFLAVGSPGAVFLRNAGPLFFDPAGATLMAWPATPSRVRVEVPPGLAGTFVLQQYGTDGVGAAVSNPITVVLPGERSPSGPGGSSLASPR